MENMRVHYCGGTSAFGRFLSEIEPKLDIRRFPAAGDAVNAGDCRALLLLPDYEGGSECVPQLSVKDSETLFQRKTARGRVYAENYVSYNFYQAAIFGCEVFGKTNHVYNETLYACGTLAYALGNARILQAGGCAYLPARAKLFDDRSADREILLKLGRYVGVSRPRHDLEDAMHALVRTGSVFTSLVGITAFERFGMAPNNRWKRVFAYLFSRVLDVTEESVESAFSRVWPAFETRFAPEDAILPMDEGRLRAQAVKNAVKWHLASGVLPGQTGEDGAFEMVMSGNKDIYRNRRVDAGLYTGWLLFAAGARLNDARAKKLGENVFRYFMNRAQLTGCVREGLFQWYLDQGAGPHSVFSIDSGRCGIALCNFYRLTGDAQILSRIRFLADGFLKWLNGDLLYSNCEQSSNPYMDLPYEVRPGLGTARTAAVYAEMIDFLTMASKLTGEGEYLARAAATADRLAAMYPNYEYYGHTTSSRNARLLMALSAVAHAGARDYADLINHLVDYLASIQLPSGAIYSEDNLSFAQFGEKDNAIGENGISTPWDEDLISDQLYCVNNALAALSIARRLKTPGVNAQKADRVYQKLINYVVKIQLTEDDPKLFGGWMRAYDVTLGEYYGLNMDMFWGPYCIMAGWTMGIIPLALLYDLQGACPYVCDEAGGEGEILKK